MAKVPERSGRGAPSPALLIATCFLVFLVSCAPKRVEIPTYEGVDLRDVLAEKQSVRTIEATLSLEFEKDGSVMRGDAALRLTPDSLDLQVYSFGFLVAEVTSSETVTKSDPPMDSTKLAMLVEGIRDSFFWWSIKAPAIDSDDGLYRVSNSWRRIFINKKTMMPEKQVIELENGRQLIVLYEEPALMDGGWVPTKMRIELSGRVLNLRIKTLSLKG